MFLTTLLTALLITPVLASSTAPETSIATADSSGFAADGGVERSDCRKVRIKWQNKTGNSVLVLGYQLGVGGKLFDRFGASHVEARTGETFTSGDFLFEGIEGMDANAVFVVYRRWQPAKGKWSDDKFRAKHTPGHPTCTDGKVYGTVKLSKSDGAI